MTIRGLSRLEQLDLRPLGLESDWPVFAPLVLFNCPVSIKEVTIKFVEDRDDDKDSIKNDEDIEACFLQLPTIAEDDICTMIRRQEQGLPNLTLLAIQAMNDLPLEKKSRDLCALPQTRTPAGPPYRRHDGYNDHRKSMVMDLMESMAPHTLEELHYPLFDRDSKVLTDKILRHSTSLQRVVISQCYHISSKAIQTILCNCRELEGLSFDMNEPQDVATELLDAVEFPLVVTNMKHLELIVNINAYRSPTDTTTATDDHEETPAPYYLRPAPIVLTDAETKQFDLLRKLYTQLGSLLQLESLYLTVNNGSSSRDAF
ncbi:hypothetical protein BGX33_011232 [Mortierella sp. NVP41]|nr:hypothetical protein BGX33_011232 [Mortierella sp. NVP41]